MYCLISSAFCARAVPAMPRADSTARSGRAALKHRLDLLGYQPSKPELDVIYEHFLIVADEKKKVENEDLIALMGQMPVLTK